MVSRLVGILASSALAQALLLPLGAAPSRGAFNKVIDPKHQLIELPCPTCAFAPKHVNAEELERGHDWFWIKRGANSVTIDFTISEDGQRLELNGAPIYPLRSPLDVAQESQRLFVNQVPTSLPDTILVKEDAKSVPLEVTASAVKIEVEQSFSPDGLSPVGDVIIPIRFDMIALEGQPVYLDEVAINLLKTGDDELLILELHNLPKPPSLPLPDQLPPGAPSEMGNRKDCSMFPAPICKFKTMIESKIEGVRPCPGRKGGPMDRMPRPLDLPNYTRPQTHGRPHHMRPHEHHHGHHKHHFIHVFAKGLVAVLIPVMAGITVGLTVSLLGLVAGRLIGFLWIKVARGGQRGNSSRIHIESEAEEGKGLMLADEDETLPAYEDAPAYEEMEKESK